MNEQMVRRTLELLIKTAETQQQWNTVKYAIDDYLDEGYHIQDMIPKYLEAYKMWCLRKRMN